MSTTEEIERLIARIALRDQQAFSALYDATSAKLYGVALRVLKNAAGAEDVLQETYVKIWKNADRYVSNGLSPMTWLITIARNTAIDRLRARKPAEDLSDVEYRMPSAGPTPEDEAIAGSEAGRIVACMDELADDRRAAVKGAYLDGASYADLAERFNVPLNTMRTWLRRALLSLRECMSR